MYHTQVYLQISTISPHSDTSRLSNKQVLFICIILLDLPLIHVSISSTQSEFQLRECCATAVTTISPDACLAG